MFQLLSKIPQFFYSPETPAPGAGGGSSSSTNTNLENRSMGKEDVIDFLADDKDAETIDLKPKGDKTPPAGEKDTRQTSEKEDETPDEENDEEVDELAELEEELEGPPEEKLELVTPVRRREILAKYPNIFKEFPYLESAYYRDQQFTEMFGTVKDAKAIQEKAEAFDNFEREVFDGKTENILKAIKEESPDNFYKLVDDYLPTLARVDERAYMHVLGNVTKHTIVAMVQEARSSNNEALQNAAAILNQFVFGTTKFSPVQNLSKQNPQREEADNKLNEREQQFLQRQFESVNTDLNQRVNNSIKNTIDQHIDPKQTMSDYVRKNAVKDAMETLESLFSRDTRFKALTDKLWEAAFKDQFSKASVDRIKQAYHSKAKTLLPSVIKKARIDALRGMGRRVKDDDDDNASTSSVNRSPVPAGRPASQKPGKIRSAKDIPPKMSTLEFLNSD